MIYMIIFYIYIILVIMICVSFSRIARRRLKKYQTATYTDLMTLSSDLNLLSLLIDLFKVFKYKVNNSIKSLFTKI